MTRSDLFRAYARVIDLCDGTNINPLSCIKLGASVCKLRSINFTDDASAYTFALAIVENKPVFAGDKLYNKALGHQFTVDENGILKIDNCTWIKPKPTTFKLNGVELSLPKEDYPRTGYDLLIDNRTFFFNTHEQRMAVRVALHLLLDGRLNDE